MGGIYIVDATALCKLLLAQSVLLRCWQTNSTLAIPVMIMQSKERNINGGVFLSRKKTDLFTLLQ
jgi:hypothetical protein